MGVMDQSVEDGIGDGGIADVLMPVFDGQLTGQAIDSGILILRFT